MTDFLEFNEEEIFTFAKVLSEKTEQDVLAKGEGHQTAKFQSAQKFNEVVRRCTLEYLQKNQPRLDALDSQILAKLLMILLSLGDYDDEDVEYWINLLEQKALQQINLYLNSEVNDLTELKGLYLLSTALEESFRKKIINGADSQQRAEFLQKFQSIQQIRQQLAKKIETKSKATPGKQKRQTQPDDTNSLIRLKSKMRSEGVMEGGEYWNNVISDYNMSMDKNQFVNDWSKDSAACEKDFQKINRLRGIEEEEKQKQEQPASEPNIISQDRSDSQNLNLLRNEDGTEQLRLEANNAANAKKQQQFSAERMIKKEFSNPKNQKAAMKAAEKLNRPLEKKDIQLMKIKAVAGKGRG